MTTIKNKARIVLNQLEYFVFLGCGQEERSTRQLVNVDLDIRFLHPPAACQTDHLTDTFCYDTLRQTIQSEIEHQPFHLIEHLAFVVYSCVKSFIAVDNVTQVCVTKYPDHFFKSAGVSFWYGDNQRDNEAWSS